MNGLRDAWAHYGPTAIGLLLGTAAKYGVTISDGKRPTRTEAIADLLMLGFLGLLGVIASDMLSAVSKVPITGNMKVFVAALAALLSARLVKAVRDRAQARAERELDVLIGARRSTPDTPEARAGAALQDAFRTPTIEPAPEDMAERLRGLDVPPPPPPA